MPTPVLVKPNLITDPGWLYYAPLSTVIPDMTVVNSVFSVAWATPWVWLGMSDSGSDWHYNMTESPIDVAELYDPVQHRITARMGSVGFSLTNYTASNLALAMNGATKTVTGSMTTGTTPVASPTTTLTKVTPVQPGQETRFMLGWESTTGDVRKIAYQCLNTGDIVEAYNKAPAKTLIAFNAMFEIPATTVVPAETWYAGVARG
jgi:hypothetical protein